MKKIYLAIPYTGMEEEAFKEVNAFCARYMEEGYIPFSPISHSHPIAVQCGISGLWDYWEKFDRSFIEWCDEVWIVNTRPDLVKKSVGVQAEIEIAKELGKPIKYVD